MLSIYWRTKTHPLTVLCGTVYPAAPCRRISQDGCVTERTADGRCELITPDHRLLDRRLRRDGCPEEVRFKLIAKRYPTRSDKPIVRI